MFVERMFFIKVLNDILGKTLKHKKAKHDMKMTVCINSYHIIQELW